MVNHRLSHAVFSSGILPVHYTRFAKTAGIGCITKEKTNKIFIKYKGHAERESENSIQVAINEEIASYEELDGINIMTDTRHGWRKNSKDTSVVALGEKSAQSYGLCSCHLRLKILLQKDMKGLEQRQFMNIWHKKMCQLKFMQICIFYF